MIMVKVGLLLCIHYCLGMPELAPCPTASLQMRIYQSTIKMLQPITALGGRVWNPHWRSIECCKRCCLCWLWSGLVWLLVMGCSHQRFLVLENWDYVWYCWFCVLSCGIGILNNEYCFMWLQCFRLSQDWSFLCRKSSTGVSSFSNRALFSTPSNELYCFKNINYKWFLFLVSMVRDLDFGLCGGVSYCFGIWIEYNISIHF